MIQSFHAPLEILGLSLRLPGAADLSGLWSILDSRTCTVQDTVPAGRWRAERFLSPDHRARGHSYTFAGGYLAGGLDFDAAAFGMSRREAEQMDPQQRLALELAWEALEDAGIAPSRLAGRNVGVYMGGSSTDYADVPGLDLPAIDAHFMTGNSLAMLSNRVSYCFDLKGPSLTVDTACSSSVVAMAQAAAALAEGRIEFAIVGAVNILSSPAPFIGFSRASMLSPTGRCRPFSAQGDGYVRAEGGAMVVMARAGEGIGACRPRALLRAIGVNSDGRTNGISLPSLTGQKDLLERLYREAAIDPDALAFVEAHGTGTRVGDPIEARAIGESLGRHRREKLPIGSVKGNIGHLEPASGMAGLAKLLLALEKRRFPASLHLEEPNPDIDTRALGLAPAVEAVELPAHGQILAGLCSYGFGGTNAHAVFESPGEVSAPQTPPPTRYLVISAHSKAALRDLAAAYQAPVARLGAAAVAAEARIGRERLAHRLVMNLHQDGDVAQALADPDILSRPDVVFGEAIAPRARVAFVFSGNGSQWPGMGSHAYQANAVFRASFDEIAARIRAQGGICPLETMLAEDVAARIQRTAAMQPLLFTIQLALCEALAAQGLSPALVLGHSVGEVAAAAVSGALSREDAVLLIVERSAHQEPVYGLGGMAVLACDAARAARLIEEAAPGDVEVAGRNAPNSTSISGTVNGLAAVLRAARRERVPAVTLDIAYPFHSRALDPEREAMLASLTALAPRACAIPMISSVTGARVVGGELGHDYWWSNIREPILFQAAMEAAFQEAELFIEIGPRPILGGSITEMARQGGIRAAAQPSLTQGSRAELDDPISRIILDALARGAPIEEAPPVAPGREAAMAGPRMLPNIAWNRQSYVIESTSEAYGLYGSSFGGPPLHPLIGARLAPGGPEWRHLISLETVPYLNGHQVEGEAVMPATALIEMALAVGREVYGTTRLRLDDFDILRAITLEPGGARELSILWNEAYRGVEIRSRPRLERGAGFVLHARVTVLPEAAPLPEAPPRPQGGSVVGREGIYAATGRCRMGYAGPFRTALAARREGNVTLTELRPEPADLGFYEDVQVIDPPAYDAALHGIFLGVEQMPGRVLGELPIRVQRLSLFEPGIAIARSIARMVRQTSDARVFDVDFLSAGNTVVARLRGLVMRRLVLASWREADRIVHTRLVPWETGAAELGLELAEALVAPNLVAPNLVASDSATPGLAADTPARQDLIALAEDIAAHLVASIAGPRLDRRDLALAEKIAPEASTVWRALIDALCDGGRMIECEDQLVLRDPPADPAGALITFAQRHPGASADLRLALRALESLPEFLTTGRRSAALDDGVAEGSLFAASSHEALVEVVDQLLSVQHARPRLRVLLLEPGLGGLLARLLPRARRAGLSLAVLTADLVATEALLARLGARQNVDLYGPENLAEVPRADLALCAGVTPLDGGAPSPLDLLASLGEHAPPLLAAIPEHHPAIDILNAATEGWFRFSLTPDMPVGAWPYPSEADAALAARGFTVQCSRDAGGAAPRLILATSRQPARAALPARRAIGVVTQDDATLAMLAEGLAGFDLHPAATVAELVGQATVLSTEDFAVMLDVGPTPIAGETEIDTLSRRMLWLREQAIALADGGMSCRLYVLLETGAVAHALKGFVRCLMNEFPGVETCLVQATSETAMAELGATLHRHLSEKLQERELILTEEETMVPRAARLSFGGPVTAGPGERSELRIGPRGLEDLTWHLAPRPSPGAAEVEVEILATGLNFRDVMLGLGVLDTEILGEGLTSGALGFEFSGRVLRVGAGVEGFAPGDGVMGFGAGAFASHVTLPATQIFHTGRDLAPETAAAIPVAFVTAWYALIERAGLRRGESVLIHGAAGGVGLAALQIAKAHGAVVIAAAGTPEKRALLRRLGADVVVDSRAVDFEGAVRAGFGPVDVVLNSVAGDAMRASLRLVKPFGRFIELGKRDFMDNTPIGLRPFLRNVSYMGVDLDQLLRHDPVLVRRMIGAIMALFEAGRLTPIPCVTFEGTRVGEAFRLMQASGHIGKILVRPARHGLRNEPEVGRFTPEAGVHVVLGGTGGFGLETAFWLAEQGARCVVVASRRGEVDATMAGRIARAQALGTAFHIEALDITSAEDVAAAFARWRAVLGPIKGVVHCAMVLEDGLILGLTLEKIARVLAPKVLGIGAVEAALGQDRLQYLVAYSSSTSFVGSPGQSAYVVGNAFLEGAVERMRARGIPALAICWGAISDVGVIARTKGLGERLRAATGVSGVTSGEALRHLGGLLADPFAAEVVSGYSVIRWVPSAMKLAVLRSPYFMDVFAERGHVGSAGAETALDFTTMTPDVAAETLARLIREEVARILRLPPEAVETDRPLIDLGLDSLMALELRLAIEKRTGLDMPLTAMAGGRSLRDLVERVLAALTTGGR